MTVSGRSITILGGGIGGLTAALALAQRGAQVRVLERAEALTEVGAGIQVSPNGFCVLRALGLEEAYRNITTTGQAVSLRDYAKGSEVVRLDLARLTPDQHYGFVHRADMIAMLAAAVRAAGVKVRLLQRATSVAPGARPRITLAHGDTVEDDLVIGADGLHSVLRPVLNGAEQPFFTGQVAWRAVVPNTINHPHEARVHMGPGRHLVSYPLRGGSLVNLVAVEERSAWMAEGWSHYDDPARLRAAFSTFGGTVPDMLAAVTRPGLWGLFRHPVAQRWHGAGVVLLGDAAHPTLPFLAQGANMALEDAWVLAACLDAEADTDRALARYQALRQPRVTRTVNTATGNAWKYHLRNPVVRGLAHRAMGMMGQLTPGRLVHQFDWLYAHDVTRQV